MVAVSEREGGEMSLPSTIEYTDEFGSWTRRTLKVKLTKLVDSFEKENPQYRPKGSRLGSIEYNEDTDMVEIIYEVQEKEGK